MIKFKFLSIKNDILGFFQNFSGIFQNFQDFFQGFSGFFLGGLTILCWMRLFLLFVEEGLDGLILVLGAAGGRLGVTSIAHHLSITTTGRDCFPGADALGNLKHFPCLIQ